MVERNPCWDAGCPALCCRNINGQWATSEKWFLEAFPNAEKVGSEEELNRLVNPWEQKVFYTLKDNWIYYLVNGRCPNLDEDKSCLIHEQRFFPGFCRKMIVGSVECAAAQEGQKKLAAIVQEPGTINAETIIRLIAALRVEKDIDEK